MTPTAARSLANRLAPVQPEKALGVAKSINSGWFRCQALAHVARYWPDEKYEAILSDAVCAADEQDHAYNRVAVSAWPIRAYLERENAPPAKTLLGRGVEAAETIENMGSRSEALYSIFQAAKPFNRDLWLPVFWALVKASEPVRSWRQLRNLKSAVSMVFINDPDVAQQSLESLTDAKNVSTVRRYLDARVVTEPRPYFWIEDPAPSELNSYRPAS